MALLVDRNVAAIIDGSLVKLLVRVVYVADCIHPARIATRSDRVVAVTRAVRIGRRVLSAPAAVFCGRAVIARKACRVWVCTQVVTGPQDGCGVEAAVGALALVGSPTRWGRGAHLSSTLRFNLSFVSGAVEDPGVDFVRVGVE